MSTTKGKKPLSIKDRKIIRGKLAGKTSKQIAAEVYPDTKTGDKIVRQRLANHSIKAALYKELAKQGLTMDKVIEPIAKAITAQTRHKIGEVVTETDEHGNATQKEYIYEYTDNLPLQMQASDRAVKLMGLDKVHETDSGDKSTAGLSKEELQQLAAESDELTLTQLVFKRDQ